MNEVLKDGYLVKDGKLIDDTSMVREHLANYLKEKTPNGLALVGYKASVKTIGVPVYALQAVDLFLANGFDVAQTGECLLPELSLMARRLNASACYVEDNNYTFLATTGSYVEGVFPIKRLERRKRGKTMRLDVQREYIRHLRRETATDKLGAISLALGGLEDAKLFSLLSQIITFKGLWRVRSDGDITINTVGESVLRLQADLGLKLNNAGTKVEFVANTGEVLKIEEVAALLARYLKEQGSLKSVARAWDRSRFFDRVAERAGLKVEKEADLILAEEIIYRPHLGVGDGLWLGLLLAEIVAVTKRPLSELISEMSKVVGERESNKLTLERNDLERFLRRLTGKTYAFSKEGELQLDEDIVAWQMINPNLYSVFLDGEPSRLHSWQEMLP